jgi:hypothetical protein
MGATQGLDISAAQGYNVNFNAIKAAGYDFVILRAGYGSALKYPDQYDGTFEGNYKRAKAAGLKVGAYWFTYCTTTQGANEEAAAFVKALSGKQFDMPVYMDIEESKQFNTGKANCSAMAKTFCEYLEKSGYFAGIYCSTFWGTNYLTDEVRERFAYWDAEWTSRCTYKGTYGMWQNGTAYVKGSGTGAMDHDYCYVDYPSIIKSKGLNGYPKPVKEEKVLDKGSCYKLGETTVGALAVKELLRLAYGKKLISVKVDDDKTYDAEAVKAVKELQKKWGYKETGRAGAEFVKKLYSVLLRA